MASRYRKKRRGTSPPPGERARKIAKRRNKGKEVERTPRVQQDEILTNPWASTFLSANAPGPSSQTISLLTPSPLPSSSFGSVNHTPYSDFTRRASSTTTFYRRMNESASYPTPHRTSPSLDTATPSATQGLAQPLASLAELDEQTTGARETLLVERRTSTRTRHTGSNAQEDASHCSPATTNSAARRQSSFHDTPMSISPLLEDDQSLDVHHSERALSSTPDLSELRERTYQSPTVEDIPEDGEIDEDRHVEETAWGPAFPRGSSSYIDRRLPLSMRSFQYNPDYEGAGHPRRFFEHAARTRLGTSFVRSTTGLDTRPPSRMSTIAERDQVSPERTLSTRSISAPPDPLHDTISIHSATASSMPSRPTGLDIFNLCNDDNVPEAVRRGGPLATMDDERPTPIPHEGDPEVHQHDPESHLRGMSDDWIQEVWADPAGTSITLCTFNPRFTKSYGSNSRTAADIRQAVTNITGETSFRVIAPDQAPGHRGRGPHEWAVTSLSTDGVERLLRRRVWSLRYITFFPRRRSLETPRLLLALEGFLDSNEDNIRNAVRSTFERPLIRQRVEQMIHANPEFHDIPAEEALRRIMSSLRISVYTLDNGTVVANVFIRSPTQSIRVWRLWVQELRDLTFGSYHTAIARARRVTICAGCTGADHPSHLCPFTQMWGWNGPSSAGGYSYSCDGRERRDRQQAGPSSSRTDLPAQHRPAGQQLSLSGNSRSQYSRRSDAYMDREADERDPERGREHDRERGRTRQRDQGGQVSARRGRREGSRPSRGTREGYRKEGRRQ